MLHYVSEICNDTVHSDDTLDATMRWAGHEEERVALLEDLLSNIQLNQCSDEGIDGIIKIHESLLDKTPMVYKLLLKTSAGIRASTAKTMTDTVIIVGGQEGEEVSPVCWEVDQTNEIVPLCDIPVNGLTTRFSVCSVPQGFIITGGRGKRLCLMFIHSTRSWVRLQDMLDKRQCHGSVSAKEKVYVFGGFIGKYTSSSDPTNSVHLLIMKEGEWKAGSNMPLAVKFPKVSYLGNSIYLLDELSNQLFRLDVDANVWNQLASLSEEEKYCVGVSLTSAHDRLLVAGGWARICASYQPATDTWCTGRQPLQTHMYGTLACLSNKLLLLGGNFSDGTDTVEEYDIDEDKWSVCSYKMPKKLRNHVAVVLSMPSRD